MFPEALETSLKVMESLEFSFAEVLQNCPELLETILMILKLEVLVTLTFSNQLKFFLKLSEVRGASLCISKLV